MTVLPSAAWRETEGLDRLFAALGAEEGATRFVGGAVRDTWLGLAVKDIDCATRLMPEDVVRRVNDAGFKAVPTGIAHGTITAVISGGVVEVTTLRRDVSTDGRRAIVAFTDDWREDAARRDFTINALSADPITGEVYDYFNGIADLEQRLVRFIGDPLQRIAEDHLRILRFFRFHARFGDGAPDPAGLTACTSRANDLMALSRERIADELSKLLAVPDPTATVVLMLEQGIFRPVLPEIDAEGLKRLRHLVERELAGNVPPDPVRRLGALLPDQPEIASGIAQRLKLSRLAARRIEQAAGPSDDEIGGIAYRLGPDVARDRLLRGSAPLSELASLENWSRPALPIKGGDLIAHGLKAGPTVAATLQAIERRWIAEGFPPAARVDQLVSEELTKALRSTK